MEVNRPVQHNTQQSPNIRKHISLILFAFILIFIASIAGIILLARSDVNTTSHIRDIFIIILALEFLFIGVALIVLVIQLAVLLNVLEHEIKPILETTRETIVTLKGTTAFLSKHAIKPVINLSSAAAGMKRLIEFIGIIRK